MQGDSRIALILVFAGSKKAHQLDTDGLMRVVSLRANAMPVGCLLSELAFQLLVISNLLFDEV